MSAESLGIVAAWCHSGSSRVIHATVDRPHERLNMGIGHMGWWGRTLCGLKGLPSEGHPFMRPLNDRDGMTFASFMESANFDVRSPCPRCRSAFNKTQEAVA